MAPTIVFILGGPGCGKGTQCARLVQHFGWKHISSGDVLRAEVASGSDVGRSCSELMSAGKLVPDEVTVDLLNKVISNGGDDKILLDGFPRSLAQLHLFEQQVAKPAAVVSFDCSEDAMVHRLMGRALVSGRADDNEETIRARLVTFRQQSVPVIEHYKALGQLHVIDAAGSAEEVFQALQEVFSQIQAQTNATTTKADTPVEGAAAVAEGTQGTASHGSTLDSAEQPAAAPAEVVAEETGERHVEAFLPSQQEGSPAIATADAPNSNVAHAEAAAAAVEEPAEPTLAPPLADPSYPTVELTTATEPADAQLPADIIAQPVKETAAAAAREPAADTAAELPLLPDAADGPAAADGNEQGALAATAAAAEKRLLQASSSKLVGGESRPTGSGVEQQGATPAGSAGEQEGAAAAVVPVHPAAAVAAAEDKQHAPAGSEPLPVSEVLPAQGSELSHPVLPESPEAPSHGGIVAEAAATQVSPPAAQATSRPASSHSTAAARAASQPGSARGSRPTTAARGETLPSQHNSPDGPPAADKAASLAGSRPSSRPGLQVAAGSRPGTAAAAADPVCNTTITDDTTAVTTPQAGAEIAEVAKASELETYVVLAKGEADGDIVSIHEDDSRQVGGPVHVLAPSSIPALQYSITAGPEEVLAIVAERRIGSAHSTASRTKMGTAGHAAPAAAAAAAVKPTRVPSLEPVALPVTEPSRPEAPMAARIMSANTRAAVSAATKSYLNDTVVPALRQGLRALAKQKPERPLKFLAEYLVAADAELEAVAHNCNGAW